MSTQADCPRPQRTTHSLSLLVGALLAASSFWLAGCAGLVKSSSTSPPPTLTISYPGSTNVTTTGAAVNWQTNVPATSQVEFGTTTAYGSTTTVDSTMVTSHQQGLSNLKPATIYHYRVHSTDANNNPAVSYDLTFTTATTPDTTPPTVSISSPANGVTVSGTITVTANASDNVGVASVQFLLDGANLGSLDTTSPYSVSWNTTAASNASHTLKAIAKDAAGNSTTSAGVTVTVNNLADTTPPSVPTSLTATAISSSQINLSWTASTDNVGVTGYNVYRGGTKIGTSTTTSYSDTGLTASTTYSYTVAAFDAASNTSAQSASASATTLSSSGGGIPPTLGWYQIPNTQLLSVCPDPNLYPGISGAEGCKGVIDDWSGGAGDTKRNRLIIWGGGHNGYYGNEVYALDLNALTITRLNNPSPPNQTGSCIETLSDGNPNSRHTYGDLAYSANLDQMFTYTGSLACSNGAASTAVWTLDLSTLKWTEKIASTLTPNGGFSASDYDPNSGNVFVHTNSWGMFGRYSPGTGTMSTLATFEDTNYNLSAVVDPKRKFFFMFGMGQAFGIDISGADAAYKLQTRSATGCSFIGPNAPGVAYDPVQDRIVGWSGGNTAYLYNPDTDACTSVTYPNGPGSQNANGTFGRFRYFPAPGVFALVNSASQNAYTLRLTPPSGTGSGPVISGVSATSITTSAATITWTTDVGATSQVEYGTTTSYGTLTTLNATLVTSHAVALAGLATNTLYHYRVHSKNSTGVESISGDFAFQTNNTTDTTPPTVSITAPAANATVSGTVPVSANATDNVAVAQVQFLLDGVNLGAAVTTAPYTVSWDTTTATNSTHTLTAAATDTSGNVGNATGVTVTVSNSTDLALADFQARCAAPGVLRCEGWDNPADFTPASGGGGYASGLYPADDGTFQGVQDTSVKLSGAGSLKFVIRAGSVRPLGTNPTGFWRANFGPDTAVTQFGPHTTLYMQFRLRLDPNMINYNWTQVSGQGWKVFIAYGPIPGPSCTGAQFVQENTNQTNVATGYASCGSPALDTNNGVPPMLIEQGDYNCPYNSAGGYTSNANCFAYPTNTWMTEYWVVQIGDWGQPNTSFQAWIAPDGQPLKQFINLPNFTFNSGAAVGDALESILLQPYFSGATGATTSPASAMWFDELIISTQPIAAPKF